MARHSAALPAEFPASEPPGRQTARGMIQRGAARPAEFPASEPPDRSPIRGMVGRSAVLFAKLGRPGRALLAVALLALPAPAAQSAESTKRVAVLDIELLKADYLPNADRIMPEERQRLDMIADLIRDRLRVSKATIPSPPRRPRPPSTRRTPGSISTRATAASATSHAISEPTG